MKWRYVIVSLPLFLAIAIEVGRVMLNQPSLGPALVASPKSFSLGACRPVSAQRLRSTLKNVSDAPLLLGMPIADCGCVRVELDSMTIPAKGETTVSIEVRTDSSVAQKRSVKLVDVEGAILATLTIAAESDDSVVVQPAFVHLGWLAADDQPTTQWLHLFIPGQSLEASPDSASVETEFDGDFVGSVEFAADKRGLWKLVAHIRLKQPAVFGYLEGGLTVRSKAMASQARVRFVAERSMSSSEIPWPSCRLELDASKRLASVFLPMRDVPTSEDQRIIVNSLTATWSARTNGELLIIEAASETDRIPVPQVISVPLNDLTVRCSLVDASVAQDRLASPNR